MKKAYFLLFFICIATSYTSVFAKDPVIVSVVDQGIMKLSYLETFVLRDKSYDFNLKDKSVGYDYSYEYDNYPHGSFIAFKLLSSKANKKFPINILDVIYEHNPQLDYYAMFADSSLALYRKKMYYKKQTSKILESWSYSVKQGAKIINFSSGSPYFDPVQISDWLDQNPEILIVVSAGNESRNLNIYPHYPCSIKKKNLFCVGSINNRYKKSDFSNYGNYVLRAFGDHKNYKGTSFAVPEVSRFIAELVYQDKGIATNTINKLVIKKFGYFSSN